MQVWNKVSKMAGPAIRKMQDELLHQIVNEEMAVRHPFYRNMFKEKGLDPAAIKSVEHLQDVPFTTKEDVAPRDDDLFRPKQFVLEATLNNQGAKKKKGSLFGGKDKGKSADDYKFYTLFYTAGRTGKPVPIEYTHYDLANLRESGARLYDVLALTRDDTMINAFTFAPNAFFWQMFYSAIDIGSTTLQTGGGKVLGMEKILKAMDSMEAPVLVAAPGYATFALQTLDHFGFSAEKLERIVIGIDYAPMEAVEKIAGLMQGVGARDNRVHRVYFNSEAKAGWGECDPGYGYHTNPDHILIEVVDPVSGKKMGEGEKGELVITHLDARGTVFLRFRTGDIATEGITYEPCPNCKRTVPRIMGDIERKEAFYSMFAGGNEITFNTSALRKYMISRDDILIWYAELENNGNNDQVKVVLKGLSGIDEDTLIKTLKDDLHKEFSLPVEVEKSTLDAIANKIGLEKNITEQLIFDTRNS